jgi:hypothetical protein
MNNPVLLSILAGIFFGAWPLLMNRSGLAGTSAAAAFGFLGFVIMLPFVLKNGISLSGANWWAIVAASACGALGGLLFNSMLASTPKETVGRFFLIMILAQTAVPALYDIVMSGQLPLNKGLGFAAAIVAAILLV